MFKYCPNCGKDKTAHWKFCPYCGYEFEKIGLAADEAGSENTDDLQMELLQTEYRIRVMILREMYDEAEALCKELIQNNPKDRAGLIGLVRIASRNYKEYEGVEISDRICAAEEAFSGTTELQADSEYTGYIAARKQYFDEKVRELKHIEELEAEHKRLEEEAEKKRLAEEEERKRLEEEAERKRLEAEAEQKRIEEEEERKRLEEEAEQKRIEKEQALKRAAEEKVKHDFEIENGILKKYRGRDGIVIIPDGVFMIGEKAFFECNSLKSVTIPESVTSIGEEAFSCCKSLTCITIPASVTKIGEKAFHLSGDIAKFEVAEDNPAYVSKEGCLVTVDGGTLLRGTNGGYIPSSVTQIGAGAFSSCEGLKSINIPDGVTRIGEGAFSFCRALTQVTIPSSTLQIEDNAFLYCSALQSVTIPDGVTSIGESAFSFCRSLESVSISGNVTTIGDLAFSNCDALLSIQIPASVTNIGDSTFAQCNHLERIEVAEGNPAYKSVSGCLLTGDGKTMMRGTAEGVIPSGVTRIGRNAFSSCEALFSISIPAGVKNIGKDAFSSCTALANVTIPDSVLIIGSDAFWGCSALERVTVPLGCRYEASSFPETCEVLKA